MMLKRTSMALVLAALVLGLATASTYAQDAGLIGPDSAKRTMQVVIGLMLAAYAKLMAKDVGRWHG